MKLTRHMIRNEGTQLTGRRSGLGGMTIYKFQNLRVKFFNLRGVTQTFKGLNIDFVLLSIFYDVLFYAQRC